MSLGVTSRQGLYVVADAAGSIICTIRKDGYVPVTKTIGVERGGPRTMTVVVRLEPAVPKAQAAVAGPASPPKTVAARPPAEPTAPVAVSKPAKGGSHARLILGAVGGAAAVGAGVAALSNPGSSTSAATPSASTLAGTYVGSAQDTAGGTGSLTLVLTHSGSYVTGSWRGAEPGWRALNGTTDGGAISATLLPSVPTACPYNLTATVSGNHFTGNYTSFNCPTPVSGAVDLARH